MYRTTQRCPVCKSLKWEHHYLNILKHLSPHTSCISRPNSLFLLNYFLKMTVGLILFCSLRCAMLRTVQYNAMFSLGIFYCFFCNNSTSKVFAALIEDGTYDWTDEELGLLASQNLINTFRFSHLSFIKKTSRLMTMHLRPELWRKFGTCLPLRERSQTTLGEASSKFLAVFLKGDMSFHLISTDDTIMNSPLYYWKFHGYGHSHGFD